MRRTLINEFSMTFLAKSENESFARQTVTAFIAQLDPTVSELADIRTAVSEAVTNSIIHGYRSAPPTQNNQVYITAKYYSDRTIVIRIRDKGCGIADIELCRQPLYTTDKSGERGGMGFAIMENFCDKIKIHSVVGRGTTICLTKKLT